MQTRALLMRCARQMLRARHRQQLQEETLMDRHHSQHRHRHPPYHSCALQTSTFPPVGVYHALLARPALLACPVALAIHWLAIQCVPQRAANRISMYSATRVLIVRLAMSTNVVLMPLRTIRNAHVYR